MPMPGKHLDAGLIRQSTPDAFLGRVGKVVGANFRTLAKVRFQLTQQRHPSRRAGTCLRVEPERCLKRRGELGWEVVKLDGPWRGRCTGGVPAGDRIREEVSRDCLAQAQVTRTAVAAGIRVLSHAKQLEDRDGEAEIVMGDSALDLAQFDAVELRRSEVLRAHDAGVGAPTEFELEAVRINQRDRGIFRDQHTGMIEISDDAAGLVHGGDGSCNVLSRPDQEAIVGGREVQLARLGTVELVDRAVSGDQAHDEAREGAGCIGGHVDREGDQVGLLRQPAFDHGTDFPLTRPAQVVLVDLDGLVTAAGDGIDIAFAAAADSFPEECGLPTDLHRLHGHLREMRINVLSSSVRSHKPGLSK